jgi:hypothetical protein
METVVNRIYCDGIVPRLALIRSFFGLIKMMNMDRVRRRHQATEYRNI